MPTVNLDTNEWNQILAVLANVPWNIANPLLMRIGEQLNGQAAPLNQAAADIQKGNSHQDVFPSVPPQRN